jgi:transcription antitermination factor NusG
MTKFKLKPATLNGRLPSLVADLAWFALTVPPQKEFAAQEILLRRGIASFCPFESLWRQKSRYTREKELRHFPVMPRYVFAGFERDPDHPVSWYHVFQIPLIVSVVGFEGEPKQVANMADFIARFRNGLKRPDAEARMRTHREYGIGDLVSFVEGPFADLKVRVEDISNGHAFFTIGMFGSDRQMSVPLEKLEAA